jgi:hypothetical protein
MGHLPAGIGTRGLSQTVKQTALVVAGSEGKVKCRQKQPKGGGQILWDPGFGILLGLALPWSVTILAFPAVRERLFKADWDQGANAGGSEGRSRAREGRTLPPPAAGTHQNEGGDAGERYPGLAFRQR